MKRPRTATARERALYRALAKPGDWTTVSVRVKGALADALDEISEETKRPKSAIAGEFLRRGVVGYFSQKVRAL